MTSHTAEKIESLAQALREAPSTSLWGAHIMVRIDKAADMYVALSDYAKLLSELPRLSAIETAAQKVFSAKGRYNTQLAMCELGDLLGIETYRPRQVWKGCDALITDGEGIL